jgi:TatA/E family protein of Tat protein translocase
MGLNWTEVVVVLVVVAVLFGGKVSGFMSDLAAGLKEFKREMSKADPPSQPVSKSRKAGLPEDGSHDV